MLRFISWIIGAPKVLLNLALSAVAGITLGIGLSFFMEYLDRSVKTIDDVEQVLELPVLGIIPKGIRLLTNISEDSADAEAYRILSTNVEFRGNNTATRTRYVTWQSHFTAAGQRALIVDADLRQPSQHQLLDLDNRVGLKRLPLRLR
jgi:hypothetical protein